MKHYTGKRPRAVGRAWPSPTFMDSSWTVTGSIEDGDMGDAAEVVDLPDCRGGESNPYTLAGGGF